MKIDALNVEKDIHAEKKNDVPGGGNLKKWPTLKRTDKNTPYKLMNEYKSASGASRKYNGIEKPKIYYWDIYDDELLKKRKKGLIMGYIIVAMVLLTYSLFSFVELYNIFRILRFYGLVILIFFLLLLWSVSIIVGFYMLNYVFLKNEKSAVKNGIKLTSEVLKIYDCEYPLTHIVYSEVVDFRGTFNPELNRWLALIISEERKCKVRLIRATETTDVMKLSNLIRQLKGIPKQTEIKSYDGVTDYYNRWKKKTLQNAERIRQM